MRILRRLYHFLLFLIVSWTVYNTFIFICLVLPASENQFAELAIYRFWNFYLFGALDFHKYSSYFSDMLNEWLDPWVLREFWPFLGYVLVVKGLAAFFWCKNQNPISACILALAPCIAGAYLTLIFRDYRLLFFGMIGIVVFYTILYNINNYRKRHYPQLTLPAWLEWRRPNMLPSFKLLAHKMGHIFKKLSS